MSPQEFINWHSYVVMAAVGWLIVSFLLLRSGVTPARGAIAVLLAGALAAGHFALRSGPTTISSAAELEKALQAGKPTLVEFYSDH